MRRLDRLKRDAMRKHEEVIELVSFPGSPPDLLDDLLAVIVRDGYCYHALEKMAEHESRKVRIAVTLSRLCVPDLLKKLAQDKDKLVRLHAKARLPSTTPDQMLKLAGHRRATVKIALLMNSKFRSWQLPPIGQQMLDMLKADPSRRVRSFAAALNPQSTEAELLAALKCGWKIARMAVTFRQHITDAVLNKLVNDRNWEVRSHLVLNRPLSEDALRHLTQDDHEFVLWNIGRNPGATDEIRNMLIKRGVPRRMVQIMPPRAQ